MINWRKKLKNIIILSILIMMLCFLGVSGNGQNVDTKIFIPEEIEPQVNFDIEESTEEIIEEPEQKVTDLNVLLIDNINGHRILLKNSYLVLIGEMQIAEDMITFNKNFTSGQYYKITVLVELRNDEEKLK